jgi:hypothetical protein
MLVKKVSKLALFMENEKTGKTKCGAQFLEGRI